MEEHATDALITNDAVIFGILMLFIALVFKTSSIKTGFWAKFYNVVPALLLVYFLPSLLNTFGIIDPHGSRLYFVASRYLLPAALILLTLSTDFKAISRLGKKAVIMFLTGTLGIMIGGPIALLVAGSISSDLAGDEVWRGMATIAGSWIGGGANQAAMREMWQPGNELFSIMVTVDIIVANIWMAFLLLGAGRSKKIDALFKADASAVEDVKKRIEDYRASIMKIPSLTDMMIMLGLVFAIVGLSHFASDAIVPVVPESLSRFSLTSKFFWLVVIATIGGLTLSFTKARKLEGAGASRMGSVFIYVLVATIGMEMDITAIFANPQFFLVGLVWMLVHVTLMLVVGRLIRAPFFFIAVGSQANVGGAASAPVVAAAFHDSLAPVGVLLAVLGYTLGTFGAYLCALLMQGVSM